MPITGPDTPLDIGDDAVLRWTYTPELTGLITDASDPTVEVYPPDGAPKVTYTLASGVVEETADHYRLYVPQTVAGPWEAYVSSATGATKGMERASWWTRARRTP
jgi:hypothetical protein